MVKEDLNNLRFIQFRIPKLFRIFPCCRMHLSTKLHLDKQKFLLRRNINQNTDETELLNVILNNIHGIFLTYMYT